jgi:DNA polymerase-1
VLHGELAALGMLNFYLRHYAELYYPLLDMMLGGIRVDESKRARRSLELAREIDRLRTRVCELAGTNLYAAKALSPKKLQEYLYDTLKLPKRFGKPSKSKKSAEPSLSTDEVTIRHFVNSHPAKFAAVGGCILEARRTQQLSTFYQEQRVDSDSYLRFSLKLNTEAGRLASSSNPKDGGSNIQNQDRECRDMYVPDPGHIFLEFDLSQAESRVVYMLSGDKALIHEATLKPWEFDHHKENAAAIFKTDLANVTKEQRQIGKIVSHGAQRDMSGKKLQEVLLKQGYVRTVKECDAAVVAYHTSHPGVKAYFRWVRQQVMANRSLANSWGRCISWPYDRLDDNLYRKAYSFLPQSEIADLLNMRGLKPLAAFIQGLNDVTPGIARLVCQVHDSLLVSVDPSKAWAIYQFVNRSLDYPLLLRGHRLTIPVEAKLGTTWQGSADIKKPVETESEFNELLKTL